MVEDNGQFESLINNVTKDINNALKTNLNKYIDVFNANNKVVSKLPVGSAIVANNYFWLHGRRPFKENKDLKRELLRIRGSFFKN